MRVFARYQSPSQHNAFVDGLLLEQRLRVRIQVVVLDLRFRPLRAALRLACARFGQQMRTALSTGSSLLRNSRSCALPE